MLLYQKLLHLLSRHRIPFILCEKCADAIVAGHIPSSLDDPKYADAIREINAG